MLPAPNCPTRQWKGPNLCKPYANCFFCRLIADMRMCIRTSASPTRIASRRDPAVQPDRQPPNLCKPYANCFGVISLPYCGSSNPNLCKPYANCFFCRLIADMRMCIRTSASPTRIASRRDPAVQPDRQPPNLCKPYANCFGVISLPYCGSSNPNLCKPYANCFSGKQLQP